MIWWLAAGLALIAIGAAVRRGLERERLQQRILVARMIREIKSVRDALDSGDAAGYPLAIDRPRARRYIADTLPVLELTYHRLADGADPALFVDSLACLAQAHDEIITPVIAGFAAGSAAFDRWLAAPRD